MPEGRLIGQRIKLTDEQLIWLQKLYGSPTRRFILSIPRKNGKTAFSAFLVLLHLCGPEAQRNSQLYSAARSRDQAAVLFELAAKMVRMSADLSAYVTLRDTAKEMLCPELGSFYKALSADAATKYGLSPALIVHDELGQVKGARDELYEALETAGAAQQSPLSIIISTQAPTDADLLSLLIDDAMLEADPKIKCVIYQVPIDDDPFDLKVLAKAQPNWELMNHEEVADQAASAHRLPSRESRFRNLVANQRVETDDPFMSREVWMKNADEPTTWAGRKVFGGLDLSATNDLTSLVLIGQRDNAWDVFPSFWLPGEGLEVKSRHDRVPYDLWAKKGLLFTTPGASIEYEFVAEYLKSVFDSCDMQAIGFDRYNMKFLKPWLEKVGFTEAQMAKFVEFGQGMVSMSPALRSLESLLLARKMRHGGHPVLNMCLHNAIVTMDPAGNRKFDKKKSVGRIDGIVALAMAVGVSVTEIEKAPRYQTFFF